MSGFQASYRSAELKPNQVIANESLYNALEKLTDGKYNRGELVLKNGEFVAVNNHVHLTLLNGTTTTREENLNVRQALSEVLDSKFRGLSLSKSPTMELVQERLLGADNRMMPISRDEVRCMIELLKVVKDRYENSGAPRNMQVERSFAEKVLSTSQNLKSDASKIGEFRAGWSPARSREEGLSFGGKDFWVGDFVKNYNSKMVNTDTANVNDYRAYSESREALSRLLGEAKGGIDDNQANRLADLALSRSQLYKEDGDFNLLIQDFKKRYGEGDAFTKIFTNLREKIKADVDSLDEDMLKKVTQERAKNPQRFGPGYTVDKARTSVREGLERRVARLEWELRSMDGVQIQDGRVSGMEALLDKKSSVLKELVAILIVPCNIANSSMVDILNDVERTNLKRQQRQEQAEQLEKALSTTGSELTDGHADIVNDLDAWVNEMRNLSGDDVAQKVETINKTLKDENVLRGGKGLIVINDDMLREMTSPDDLLTRKEQYVKSFKELSALGFSDKMIGTCLNKDVLLVAGPDAAMRLALRKIIASLPEKDGLAQVQNAIAKARAEREAIRDMKTLCGNFLERLSRFEKDQNADLTDLDSLRTEFKPLIDAARQMQDDHASFGTLSLKLPSFIKSLEQREAELGSRINCLEGGSVGVEPAPPEQPKDGAPEKPKEKDVPEQPKDFSAKLWEDLTTFLASSSVDLH